MSLPEKVAENFEEYLEKLTNMDVRQNAACSYFEMYEMSSLYVKAYNAFPNLSTKELIALLQKQRIILKRVKKKRYVH